MYVNKFSYSCIYNESIYENFGQNYLYIKITSHNANYMISKRAMSDPYTDSVSSREVL